MIKRDDIPLGCTRDENGNILTCKDSGGYWYEYTRDENGNILTCKDSGGYWYEYTYDENGNVLTFKNSDGFWYEYTRDENGKVLTHKDSNGTARGFEDNKKEDNSDMYRIVFLDNQGLLREFRTSTSCFGNAVIALELEANEQGYGVGSVLSLTRGVE